MLDWDRILEIGDIFIDRAIAKQCEKLGATVRLSLSELGLK